MHTTKSFINEDGNEAKIPSQPKETSCKVYPLNGYPFAAIERGDEDYVIVFGNHMITARCFFSPEACKEWLDKTEWQAILNVVGIYFDHMTELNRIERIANLKKITNNE